MLDNLEEIGMGFGNLLTTMVKNMARDIVDSSKEVQRLKSEYQKGSLPFLEDEFIRLKASAHTKDNTNRKLAVANILVERRKNKK